MVQGRVCQRFGIHLRQDLLRLPQHFHLHIQLKLRQMLFLPLMPSAPQVFFPLPPSFQRSIWNAQRFAYQQKITVVPIKSVQGIDFCL